MAGSKPPWQPGAEMRRNHRMWVSGSFASFLGGVAIFACNGSARKADTQATASRPPMASGSATLEGGKSAGCGHTGQPTGDIQDQTAMDGKGRTRIYDLLVPSS